jgi:hypothetical protein
MKTLICVYVATLAFLFAACGGLPPDDGASVEKTGSALMAAYQTVPSHNVAVTSGVYSCNGWSYRTLFSLEQHQDGNSPTGWYAAVGPSSRAATGAVTNSAGSLDVSADVYLQCVSGILPVHSSGTFPSGAKYNEVYADYRNSPISCTMMTVWPASWHQANPVLPVHLLQYDWDASINVNSPDGTVFLDIDIDVGFQPAPGNGFCNRRWFGGGITGVAKFTPPPPQVPFCTGDSSSDYLAGGCIVPPPDCTYVGHGPCPPSPDAT